MKIWGMRVGHGARRQTCGLVDARGLAVGQNLIRLMADLVDGKVCSK